MDQRYALVILSDGGLDLETFKFDSENGWKQAAGVFWQTADALARAEQWTSFEVSSHFHEVCSHIHSDTLSIATYMRARSLSRVRSRQAARTSHCQSTTSRPLPPERELR